MADENEGARPKNKVRRPLSNRYFSPITLPPSRKNIGERSVELMPSDFNQRDKQALESFEKNGSLTHDERIAQALENRKEPKLKERPISTFSPPIPITSPHDQSPYNRSMEMSFESPLPYNRSMEMQDSFESPYRPNTSPIRPGPFKFTNTDDKYNFNSDEGVILTGDEPINFSGRHSPIKSPDGGKKRKTKRFKRRKTKRRKSIRLHR